MRTLKTLQKLNREYEDWNCSWEELNRLIKSNERDFHLLHICDRYVYDCQFTGILFSHCIFTDLSFSNCQFTQCIFTNCKFVHVDFYEVSMVDCEFTFSTFTNMDSVWAQAQLGMARECYLLRPFANQDEEHVVCGCFYDTFTEFQKAVRLKHDVLSAKFLHYSTIIAMFQQAIDFEHGREAIASGEAEIPF